MSTEVDRLELLLTANINDFNKKLDLVVKKMDDTKKKTEASANGIGSAFDKGFKNLSDRMGEAAKAIPGLGSALGALGPAGIAAAAGIGAVIEVLHGAKDAIEFADNLHDTAARLHITTDALQEYQFALRESGGRQEEVATSLMSFTEALGRAEEGLPRALKGFQALFGTSFTAENVKQMGGVQNALIKISGAVQNLSNQQRAAVLSQLGLSGMKQFFEKPLADQEKLLANAHTFGDVMDKEVIEKGSELNKQFDIAHDKLDKQLKTALIEAGPFLLDLVKYMADLATKAALVVDAFKSIKEQRPDTLRAERAQAVSQRNDPIAGILPGVGPDLKLTGGTLRQQKDARIAAIDKQLAEDKVKQDALDKAEQARLDADAKGLGAGLHNVGRVKAAPKATTAELDKKAQDALSSSAAELAKAQGELATTLEDRAALERQALQDDLTKKLADLNAELIKIAGDELDKNKAAQTAKIKQAELNEEQATFAKQILVDEKWITAAYDEQIAAMDAAAQLRNGALSAEADHLTALAALAVTTKDRNELESRALAIQQQADRELAENTLARAKTELQSAKDSGADKPKLDAAQRALDAAQQAVDLLPQKQADTKTAQDQAHEGPVQVYERQIQDLNKTMSEAGVQAAQALSSGLADAIVNAKNLGDVASSVFKQLIQTVLQAEIEKNFAGPILALLGLPGHAAGTLSSASGWAMVGERGPELVKLPGASQVISNAQLRNVGIGSQSGVNPIIVFDNRGAIIWEQAAKQLMSYADQAAAMASVGAVQAARRVTSSDLAKASGRKLQ